MEKTYERINWENYPSVVTPINEKNLNKMDQALDEVDNRVIGLDTAKLDKATANTMVKDVSFDENTGIFTITYLNRTVKKVDTALEKIATNFTYNRDTQKLLLTLVDGTEQEVDLSSLISQYEFTDSDFIAFTVDADGKVSATIKTGSITEDMLQPNFLADVKVEVEKAKKSSDSASAYAEQSKQYRDEAEQIKKEIESVTDVEIATTEKAGIVKPDGDTITIDENGKISAKQQSGGASSWNDLENKPFKTVGNGLTVEDEVLQVDMLKTMEEVEVNEDENKLASALAMKVGFAGVNSDLDNAKKDVFYNRISVQNIDDIPEKFSAYSTTTNTLGTFPSGFNKVGVMIPIRRTSSVNFQVYIDANNNMATRMLSGGTWGDWDVKASSSDLCGFIDPRTIVDQVAISQNSTADYTATEDCYFRILLVSSGGSPAKVSLVNNGNLYELFRITSTSTTSGEQAMHTFPLKKGQTVRVSTCTTLGSYYVVYGMIK